MNLQINNLHLYDKNQEINKHWIASYPGNAGYIDSFLHNEILNYYVYYLKDKKTLSEKHFRSILPIIYRNIFNMILIYKNLLQDFTGIENCKRLLTNYSFINTYEIIKYYNTNEILTEIEFKKLTALFYSTLHFFILKHNL